MDKKSSDYSIKSIKRTVQVINSFTANAHELGVTELSKMLNLHKSTVHRILITLSKEGLVVKNPVNQKYRLGIIFFKWGCIVQNQIEIRSYALPIMKDLAKSTEESVALNIISNNKRIIIEKIESPNEIQRVLKLGENLPLYFGSAGKVLLASLSDEEFEKCLKEERLISFTPHTITNKSKLMKNLHEIREKGYAIAIEERIPGGASIGAPIFDYTGKVIAALSISGPVLRFSEEKIPILISLVQDAAMKISVLLGYSNKNESTHFIS